MKNSIKILLIIFCILLSACNEPKDEVIVEEFIAEISEEKYQKYENLRYGFTVEIPQEWHIGQESDNGDGVNLYIGNPDVKILAYASNYLDGISDPYQNMKKDGYELQRIALNNGKVAELIVGRYLDYYIYDLVYIENEIVYTVYAEVPKTFFETNQSDLMKLVKSLNVLE